MLNKKSKSKISHHNFFPKNRKGGDKVISVYWFVILILVAGGVYAMVSSFYNYPYDVREVEAELMTNKIADCLSASGQLNSDIFGEEGFNQEFEDNFLDECEINLNSELDINGVLQYYFKIDFYSEDNLENSVFEIVYGNKALPASCDIQEEKEYKREAKCVEDNFFSSHENKLYLIKILSIVKKTEKNVK